jgi:hypothetical protein
MGAETHWAFVASAYAAALGLPSALALWVWARAASMRRRLAAAQAARGSFADDRKEDGRKARADRPDRDAGAVAGKGPEEMRKRRRRPFRAQVGDGRAGSVRIVQRSPVPTIQIPSPKKRSFLSPFPAS